MKKEAKFWKTLNSKKVQCVLCLHKCKIDEGKTGICEVRKNEGGKLYSLIYGSCSSMAVDPIEKKPFYHFHPGTNAFSVGTVGCNFKCKHCQNYGISTAKPDHSHLRDITSESVIEHVKNNNCQGIAWTYNEPTIWYEFSLDSSKLAKKHGLYTCYVTNGYIGEEPLKEISPYLDAMNVDVKAFTDDFYKNICKASLEPVLNTCELAKELKIHLELTYLVIPGYNDSLDEIKKFCNWVAEKLGNNVPIHFSRFHPDHNMTDVKATPIDTLLKIYDVAKNAGLLFPYLGNVPHGDYENTICPKCENVCIKRHGFSTDLKGITNGKCTNCGTKVI